jgi:hypothetical protein
MDEIMRRVIFLFPILCASLCATNAQAEDKAALAARLDRVNKITALDDPTLKPWNMKIAFSLDDNLGKLKEQGTLEEWWAGPSLYKISIVSPSYTATTIVNRNGRFRTTGTPDMPYMLEVLERQMVHPMPRSEEVSGLSPQTVKIENAPTPAPECIMMGEQMRNVPFPQVGLLPTYCLVPGKDLLQASYDYGNLMVARTAMGMFQQKVMPIDIRVFMNRVDTASSHLLALKTAPLTEADFVVPATGMASADVPVVHVLYRDLHSEIASVPAQAMPTGLQPSVLSAPVEVAMRIGTDGGVHSVRLVSTPDIKMAAPAMWIAANTKFTPHHKDDKLVEVDTIANIYFSKALSEGEIGPKK